MKKFWTKLTRSITAFRGASAGNVMITFALATLPVVGTVGFAVDYSHANSVKAAMQAALDSTALMLAKDASTVTNAVLQTNATNYFNALFTRPEATNIQIAAAYTTTGGSQVTVTGSANVPTAFLGIIGYKQIAVNGSSTTQWGTTRLRVALVLDTTGSMADDGKMPAMQTATKSLLTQLQSAASTNGDVYVSIISFSKNVNVGSSNYNASWIDWTEWDADPPYMDTWLTNSSNKTTWEQAGPGDSCPFGSSTSATGFRCTTGPSNSAGNTNTIPSSGSYSGYICPGIDAGNKIATKGAVYYNGCYNSVTTTRTISTGSSASCGSTVSCTCSGSGSSKKCKQQYWVHNWIANNHNTWNGCVTDRGVPVASAPGSNDYDQLSTAPGSSAESKFPAEQYDHCTTTMSGLSYNWSAMTSLVNSLTPDGNTNQPIGLVWGWQSLVGGGPLTMPAKAPNYNYTDVIILLSDGLNTQDRWYTAANSIDKRMYDSSNSGAGTCANIKNSGVTIYTIQVNTGGDPTSTIMQNCAGSPDKMIDPTKFYMLTTAGQIAAVFNTIGTNLTQLRVAK